MSGEEQDFDAWRASQRHTRETVRIFGEDVPIPADLPLGLMLDIEDADTDDTATMLRLVADVYGSDELDRWVHAGIHVREFAVLLAWTLARTQGQDLTFAEAADAVAGRGDLGKAPANREERRAQERQGRRRGRR